MMLIWLPVAKGTYSIKEGYKLLQSIASEENPSRAYMFCWNNVVLPKDGCFAWLAIKNRILTSDHLERLNVAPPFKCVLFQDEYESVDHLFASCQFVYQCWMFVLRKLNFSKPLHNKIWDIFQPLPILFLDALFGGI